jgi:D-arabinose 5-phosphate isomerase GutQ
VLAVFTTTGNSENVFRALLAAKDQKLKTIAFLGRDGGDCAGLADVELLVAGKAERQPRASKKATSFCCIPSANWSMSNCWPQISRPRHLALGDQAFERLNF